MSLVDFDRDRLGLLHPSALAPMQAPAGELGSGFNNSQPLAMKRESDRPQSGFEASDVQRHVEGIRRQSSMIVAGCAAKSIARDPFIFWTNVPSPLAGQALINASPRPARRNAHRARSHPRHPEEPGLPAQLQDGGPELGGQSSVAACKPP